MNTFHHIASFRFALLLLVLAPGSLAQASPDDGFLPEGIEATGDTAENRASTVWADEHERNYFDQEEAHYTTSREALEDERELVRNTIDFVNVYNDRGEFREELSHYFARLRDLERLGDTEGQASTLNNIGNVHLSQGNREEASMYYERAVALAETLDKPVLLVNTLNGLGTSLTDQDEYERAESVYRQALTISQEWGYQRHSAVISNNFGFLFNRQERYEQALPFLFVAERLSNELGEEDILIATYDELGKAYLGLGRYDLASFYADESLTLSRKTGSVFREMDAHQTLSEIYEAAGDDGQALAHHREYAAARDSVLNAEKAEIITDMQTRYETEEKQRAIERLEYQNRTRLILFLASVGGLLLFLGFLYNRYRLKQKANRLLEELDAAKSRFFANISHEFRTPLTVILGSVQDALAGRFKGDEEKLTTQLQAMQRNSRQLQGLIDEVLDLNRLEAGKLELKPIPGDLVRSLRRIVEADAPLAERNGIDLTFESDVEHCPRLYDPEKLEKIVGNLLSNALKFTPKGGEVRVHLSCGKETEIVVSDDGPGIPAEIQEKVFERFEQAGDGSQHGGTGIGLALAKELAELHGGTIILESESGEGSTFTVRLPLEKVSDDVGTWHAMSPQQNTDSVPPEESVVGGDGHEERHDGVVPPNGDVEVPPSGGMVAQQAEETDGHSDRTTVLIIEDNDDVRAYVRRSLEETYRVLEAADGETGLQQAREALPDLIVSDVMLPGIDGYEIARQLKVEPATECIPVVMLTARAAEEDQVEGYGSGAEVYITKPFSPETLRAAVARLLEERQRLRRRLQENTKREAEPVSGNDRETLAGRARTVVLENLHDEGFGVEELASALGISHRSLYRHLKPEVGLSPGDFVRDVRLERARQLLSDGAGSVSEVAYAVGFKSLSHFTRTFRERYGTLPSSVLEAQES